MYIFDMGRNSAQCSHDRVLTATYALVQKNFASPPSLPGNLGVAIMTLEYSRMNFGKHFGSELV